MFGDEMNLFLCLGEDSRKKKFNRSTMKSVNEVDEKGLNIKS